MILHGGHDGTRHLQDTHIFDFATQTWAALATEGTVTLHQPIIANICISILGFPCIHVDNDDTSFLRKYCILSMALYASGVNTAPFLMLLYVSAGPSPSPRDSHVAVVHGRSMYLYGGSTGSAMGDFHELRLEFRRVWRPVTLPGKTFDACGSFDPDDPSY